MGERAAPDEARNEQDAVLAFLLDPATHGGETPEHIETHLSHIVLAAGRALKLKKARAWSVVDYSTVERRERYCRKEYALNARFAPALYLGVRAITNGAGLQLDGDGEAVDFVVEMRRFADDAQLDRIVEAGGMTAALTDATADAVAALHRAAPIRRIADHAARVERLTAQLERDVGAALSSADLRAALAQWADTSRALIAQHARMLDARGRHGFVRRCHADLHLSNLCVWNGVPTPFDALEFSEEIATIDVLYDLAFVLVDLEHRGQHACANRLLSRYLEWTRDYRGIALLPLWRGLRSMVRALTGAAKGRDPSRAVEAAHRAVMAPRTPCLVAVGGRSGTGKTTLARALAPRLGAVVIRSDTTRKHLNRVAPEDALPPSAYRPGESERVYRRMRLDGSRALGAKVPVILDATFLEPDAREAVAALAARCGVGLTGVWLEAPGETLLSRVDARGPDASDADAAVVRAQLGRAVGGLDWTVLDARQDAHDLAGTVHTLCGPSA